jgi:DNA invertase Pin-like site-specific DNA recombinase
MRIHFPQKDAYWNWSAPLDRRVAIYARASQEDPDGAVQLSKARAYCARQRWHIFAEFVDTECTGDSQPALEALKTRAALKSSFGIVCVWRLDRWARTVSRCIENIVGLTSQQVRFIAIQQSIDSEDPTQMSRRFPQLLAAFAELDRELRREQVLVGMWAAKQRGISLGRKKIVVDETKVRDLHATGCSIRKISQQLQLSRSVVHRSLKKAA